MALSDRLGGKQTTSHLTTHSSWTLLGTVYRRPAGARSVHPRRVEPQVSPLAGAARRGPRSRRRGLPWARAATLTSGPSALSTTASLSGVPKASPAPTWLTTSRSQPLARQLGPAVGQHVAGLRAEADDDLAGGRRLAAGGDQVAQHVRVLRQLDRPRRPGGFLIFVSLRSAGRKSATAAAITMASAPPAAASMRLAQLAGRADPQDLDAGRVGQLELAATRVTSGAAAGGRDGQRVALPAGGPVAEEADRVEVLAGAAGRDQHVAAGQVGGQPGGAAGQHPDRDGVEARRARAAGRARCRRRSAGRRPGPARERPAPRSVATLARVAGCSHISVCMAGANTTGQRAVSSTAVSRSSDIPAAARAIRSAVAGATMTRSASWPSRTCGTSCTSSHGVGRDRLAGQRRPGGGADEVQGVRGRHDPDLMTGLGEQPQQLAGLVRRDARALTPRTIAHRRSRSARGSGRLRTRLAGAPRSAAAR